jgi:IPT/TIG domain
LGIRVFWQMDVSLQSAAPLTATSVGGATIVLTGQNFDAGFGDDVQCKFGTVLSGGKIVSPTSVECISPPHAAGAVPLEVSIKGGLFTNNSGVQFTFTDSAVSAYEPRPEVVCSARNSAESPDWVNMEAMMTAWGFNVTTVDISGGAGSCSVYENLGCDVIVISPCVTGDIVNQGTQPRVDICSIGVVFFEETLGTTGNNEFGLAGAGASNDGVQPTWAVTSAREWHPITCGYGSSELFAANTGSPLAGAHSLGALTAGSASLATGDTSTDSRVVAAERYGVDVKTKSIATGRRVFIGHGTDTARLRGSLGVSLLYRAIVWAFGRNYAPSISPGSLTLPAVQNGSVSADETVPAILASLNYADANRPLDATCTAVARGMAIVGVQNGPDGSWQFRVSGGVWAAVPTDVADGNAFLLDSTSELRFDASPSVALGLRNLTVRGWDRTTFNGNATLGGGVSPAPLSRADITTLLNGGEYPFSAASAQIQIDVVSLVATTGVPTTGDPTTGVPSTGVPTTGVVTSTTGQPTTTGVQTTTGSFSTTGVPTTTGTSTGVPTTTGGVQSTSGPAAVSTSAAAESSDSTLLIIIIVVVVAVVLLIVCVVVVFVVRRKKDDGGGGGGKKASSSDTSPEESKFSSSSEDDPDVMVYGDVGKVMKKGSDSDYSDIESSSGDSAVEYGQIKDVIGSVDDDESIDMSSSSGDSD